MVQCVCNILELGSGLIQHLYDMLDLRSVILRCNVILDLICVVLQCVCVCVCA